MYYVKGSMAEPEGAGELRAAFLTRVATVMRAQGLTQTEVAERLGVTQAAVSGWFAKGSFPGDVILRMPDALNVNGHWLLTGQGPMAELLPDDPGYAAGVRDLAARVMRLAAELEATSRSVSDEDAIRAVHAAKAAEGKARKPGRRSG